jgi:hypothetical protein
MLDDRLSDLGGVVVSLVCMTIVPFLLEPGRSEAIVDPSEPELDYPDANDLVAALFLGSVRIPPD